MLSRTFSIQSILRHSLIVVLIVILTGCNTLRNMYTSQDFTSENQFSENIEGPAFNARGQLFVVNYIHDGTIGQVSRTGECSLFLELPKGSIANSIQFNRRGNMLLADFTGHNILHVDMKTKEVSVFCHQPNMNQPNDICINHKDQLFATDPDWKTSTGQLWRIDKNGESHLLEKNMGTTNGIELSPNEKILYVNESVQRKIWKYRVDKNGNISDKQLFYTFNDYGLDGMKCDNRGNLYITRWGKGTIAVISPKGKFIREIKLKGKKCSNLVFGGADGCSIYVTMQDRKCMEKVLNSIPGKRFQSEEKIIYDINMQQAP